MHAEPPEVPGAGGGDEDTESPLRPPVEEIGDWLARLYGMVDLEKSDVAAGLVLASVLQAQQRRSLAATRLRQHGVQLDHRQEVRLLGECVHDGNGNDTEPQSGHQRGTIFEQTVDIVREERERQQRMETAEDADAAENGRAHETCLRIGTKKALHEHEAWKRAHKADSPFHRWLHAISQGSEVIITPTAYAARLAPTVDYNQLAELYCDANDRVDVELLQQAMVWANYALASYGTSAYVTNKVWFHGRSSIWTSWKLRIAAITKLMQLHHIPEPIKSRLMKDEKYLR
jgi:hypothetical protein